MNDLQELLIANGIEMSSEELRLYLQKKSVDPDAITEAEIIAISEELVALKKASNLIVSSNGKTAKTTKRTAKTNKAQQSMSDYKTSLANQAKQSLAEIQSFNSAITQGTREFAHKEAVETIETLANVSNEYLAEVAQFAKEFQGEPEAFFRFGQEITSLYLSASNADATE
ncbi:hypothetical protein ACWATR_34210 [Nostoc sp. UIC 10890]|jgi:hypothetical protein